MSSTISAHVYFGAVKVVPFGPPAQERGFAFLRVKLFPAFVVRHTHCHTLVRGVAAAVRAGDANRIDASAPFPCPLGSK